MYRFLNARIIAHQEAHRATTKQKATPYNYAKKKNVLKISQKETALSESATISSRGFAIITNQKRTPALASVLPVPQKKTNTSQQWSIDKFYGSLIQAHANNANKRSM